MTKKPIDPRIKKDKWILLTEHDNETYNSNHLIGIHFSPKEKHPDFFYGKLLVRFDSTGTYVYDLPFEIFVELAKRAFKDLDYDKTTGDWYNNEFYDYVQKYIPEDQENLYVSKKYHN